MVQPDAESSAETLSERIEQARDELDDIFKDEENRLEEIKFAYGSKEKRKKAAQEVISTAYGINYGDLLRHTGGDPHKIWSLIKNRTILPDFRESGYVYVSGREITSLNILLSSS